LRRFGSSKRCWPWFQWTVQRCDHKAYWSPIRALDEARYLCAIINSDTVLQRVIPKQSRGWRDPRDFDNLVWELPIPEFDGTLELHRELAAAGVEAETIASTVVLPKAITDASAARSAVRSRAQV
jgi:hypothetical protein